MKHSDHKTVRKMTHLWSENVSFHDKKCVIKVSEVQNWHFPDSFIFWMFHENVSPAWTEISQKCVSWAISDTILTVLLIYNWQFCDKFISTDRFVSHFQLWTDRILIYLCIWQFSDRYLTVFWQICDRILQLTVYWHLSDSFMTDFWNFRDQH